MKRLAALALPLVLTAAPAARGEEPALGEDASARVTVRLLRVVDARGSRVVDLFRVERVAPDERRTGWFVHGLVRDDLVVRSLRRAGADGKPGEAARYEIALGEGTRLVLERPGGRERVTARAAESTVGYFEEDLGTRTVRCALGRLAETADPLLLAAVREYGRLKEVLETRDLADEEYPVYVLWRVEEPPPLAVAPAWRLVTADADDPSVAPLREAALAVLTGE